MHAGRAGELGRSSCANAGVSAGNEKWDAMPSRDLVRPLLHRNVLSMHCTARITQLEHDTQDTTRRTDESDEEFAPEAYEEPSSADGIAAATRALMEA